MENAQMNVLNSLLYILLKLTLTVKVTALLMGEKSATESEVCG
jgi:hypothetical protein